MSRETTNVLPAGWDGTTHLNSKIESYNDLANRIKLNIGASLDIDDTYVANAIDVAIERYSRYAGYEEQYVVFCDDALDSSCEVKLDDLVMGCMCEDMYNQESLITTEVITSTEISSIFIGGGLGLLSAQTYLSSYESPYANTNLSTTSEAIDEFSLYFDPESPWDFDACGADKVVITPLSSYTEQETLSPCLNSLLNIKDGKGVFYPPNWETLNKCGELSSWWGLTSFDELSSFNPDDATHIIIKNVPSCTVGGLNCLSINNAGKAGEIIVTNKELDTCGDMSAQIQYVKDYSLPSGLSGEFDITSNTGFKLELSPPANMDCTSYKTPINVDFYSTLSSNEYGLSSYTPELFDDESLNCPRKIVDVFSVLPTGGNNSGGLLFNFNHMTVQGMLGYDGMGNRFGSNGYDLVSYEMVHQLLETSDRMFGSSQNSFKFNQNTQKLRVFKSPRSNCSSSNCYILGVKLEQPISTMITKSWVQDYATALVKIMQGNAMAKYSGVVVLDGVTINSADVLAQGISEKTELELWLRNGMNESEGTTPFLIC